MSMRVNHILRSLDFQELVCKGLIPDVAEVFNQSYPNILGNRSRFPKWVYSSVRPQLDDKKSHNFASYYGYFMDFMVRKMISLVIPVHRYPDSIELPDYFWSDDISWNRVAKDTAIAVGKIYREDFELSDDVFNSWFYSLLGQAAKTFQPMFENCAESEVTFEAEITVTDGDVTIQAHPDIVTANSVIDIKTSSSFAKMAKSAYLQILCYVAIMRHAGRQVDYMGLLMPIQRGMMMVDISNWSSEPFMDYLFQEARKLQSRPGDELERLLAVNNILQGVGFTLSRTNRQTNHTMSIPETLEMFIQLITSGFHPHDRLSNRLGNMLSAITDSNGEMIGIMGVGNHEEAGMLDPGGSSSSQWNPTPCQIFLAGNRRMIERPISDEDIVATHDLVTSMQIPLYIHAPYTINLSVPLTVKDTHRVDLVNVNDEFFQTDGDCWVLNMFRTYIETTVLIGGRGIVVHVGKHKDLLSVDDAKHVMMRSLRGAIEAATYDCPVLLETPCGCKSEICWRPEELSEFYNRFSAIERQRLKICIDTCHVFVAGYDPFVYLEYWIGAHGAESIGLIHFNDSRKHQGCRADGHNLIGHGNIDLTSLRKVADLAKHHQIPMVTE